MASIPHTLQLIPWLLTISSLSCTALSLTFDYPSLGNPVQKNLISVGNVSTFPTYVELTLSNNDPKLSAGRLYHSDYLSLWDDSSLQAASFNSSFQFRILQNSASDQPADGLTFLLLHPSSLQIPDDAKGSWLGLFNASTNGSASAGIIAVEFDTFHNYFDPNNNHIGIDVNSIVSAVTMPDLSFDLASSVSVFSWIDYSSSLSLLEVYATNLSSTKPSTPLLSYSINLTEYLPEEVLIGFSAATGSSSEYNRVLSWSFNSTSIGTNTAKTTNVGLYAGLGIGILFFLAGVAVLVGLRMRKQRRRQRICDQAMSSRIIDMSGLPSFSSGAYGPRKFEYRDLSEATRNFGEDFLLGQGGFGPVYKGVLPEDGSEVAVKCISQRSAQGEKEFFAEVSIISRIRHKNLVQLKGWCRDRANLLLVYEYLPNGSLDRYLFSKSSSSTLDWSTRYTIVCGLGSALQYLHQECEKVIVHRDLKASNVMLDVNYNAKLGDFGLARQLGEGVEGHTTLPAGTVGYMAPETYGTGRATPDSDVYSYGLVLLEVACGRRPVDLSLPARCEGRLLDWVWDMHSKGTLMDVADSRLVGKFDEAQMVLTLTVGLACAHPDPKLRPSIHLALEALQGRAPLPTIPTFKPVAYYGPPLPDTLFTSSFTATSCATISSSSSAPDVDLSEKSLLH